MDSGLTIRPSDSAAQAAIVRPTPTPVQKTVATELAPSQAVTAAQDAEAARNDQRQTASERPATRVDIAFDKKTHTSVYRLLDAQTGKVLLQIPQKSRSADLTV